MFEHVKKVVTSISWPEGVDVTLSCDGLHERVYKRGPYWSKEKDDDIPRLELDLYHYMLHFGLRVTIGCQGLDDVFKLGGIVRQIFDVWMSNGGEQCTYLRMGFVCTNICLEREHGWNRLGAWYCQTWGQWRSATPVRSENKFMQFLVQHSTMGGWASVSEAWDRHMVERIEYEQFAL